MVPLGSSVIRFEQTPDRRKWRFVDLHRSLAGLTAVLAADDITLGFQLGNRMRVRVGILQKFPKQGTVAKYAE